MLAAAGGLVRTIAKDACGLSGWEQGSRRMDTEAHAAVAAVIDIDGIQQMIPHRYPFLMIDRVVDLVVNVRATGIKNVTINEYFFQGHFPAEPVMPGVLLVEAMAQTAAVLVVATLGPEMEGRLVYFMSVEHARFRKPVVPGDTLAIHVEKERNRGMVWKFKGRCLVEGTLVAEAVYTAMIRDR